MYVQTNPAIPVEQVIGLDVSQVFIDLKSQYDIINLPYTSNTKGSITIAAGAMKQIGYSNLGFVMVYFPTGITKCLWTITKAQAIPASVFYDFEIGITSTSNPLSYVFDLAIANKFTPIYNDDAVATWANASTKQYMGTYITSWTVLGSATWNDLAVTSFENVYADLPTIDQTTTWQLSADISGNISDVVKYTISSGQLSYNVQFTVTGTAEALVLSNLSVKISGLYTAKSEATTFTFVPSDNPITGTLEGQVSSYKVTLWNTMDTLLAINMQDPTDVVTIYNNGTAAISPYIVTGNN